MSWRFQPQNKLPEFYFTSSGSPIVIIFLSPDLVFEKKSLY